MISVVILTQNEADDLPGCLESLRWCDDVHVLDSGSTDRTVEIAIASGANTWYHPFEGFGLQRTYALEHLILKYEWILFLDADEQATNKFRAEIQKAVLTADESIAGFYCCSKLILEDRWLKRSDTFPKWQFRLLRKGRARFMNLGHGQKECDIKGQLGYIKEGYLHFGMSKGWTHWIERHNRYSSLEAAVRLYNCPPFTNIFIRHPSIRNVALKCWLSKMPLWPFIRFLHAYFFNLGFLEGVQGFLYCINNAYYEFMISLKMRELRRKDKMKMKVASPVRQLSSKRLSVDHPAESKVAGR